ncbi:polysaccharide biosynthesis tyrosine autokinase [Rhodococcus opacus]|uniref:polysaccharide biosynthesis tyrosine autokinase n=1 Tax=Rhodococcus opacus TaxID=37919 RepID=UPI002955767E|nr:polysaccharide biosynthesis tyrosine autokinase [Rhodococcus opacus]MDV7088120.1 polysaccharide biosynthesis tyrosine autokinase [Rhodococcus opacus]
MDIQDYLRILRTRWPIVITTTVLAVLVVLASAMVTTNMYQSSTRVFVYPQSRVASYAQLLNGGVAVERTLERLNLPMSKTELSSKITSRIVGGTMLVRVTVEDTDPDRAQAIANTVSEEGIALARELEKPDITTSPQQDTDSEASAPLGVSGPQPTLGFDASGTLIEPTPRVTLETPATAPTKIPTDTIANIPLAAVVGLLLGLALAVLRDRMDKTIKDSSAIEGLAGTDVVGAIPSDSELDGIVAFTQANSNSESAQEYRRLSANLQYRKSESHPRVTLFTTPRSNEGRDSTAANTALALAEAGHNVCLVEADLRSPTLARIFAVSNDVGLSDVLAGKIPLTAVQKTTEFERLTLVPAGPVASNPSHLLGSPATRTALDTLRAHFDYVVISAAPQLPVADATVLSALADGVLIVVSYGVTRRDDLARASAYLRTIGATILGVVVAAASEKVDAIAAENRDNHNVPADLASRS